MPLITTVLNPVRLTARECAEIWLSGGSASPWSELGEKQRSLVVDEFQFLLDALVSRGILGF